MVEPRRNPARLNRGVIGKRAREENAEQTAADPKVIGENVAVLVHGETKRKVFAKKGKAAKVRIGTDSPTT
jgi:hypothetical protein